MRKKIAICRTIRSLLFVLATGFASSASGQVAPAKAAAEPEAKPSALDADLQFSVEANSRFGVLTYVPAQWGELHLQLENGGDAPRDLLCTSYLEDDTTLQFGRQIWLPARSRLSLSHPVFLPPADRFTAQAAHVHSLVIDNAGGKEVLVKSESGQLRHDQLLLISPADRNTGVIAGWSADDGVPQDVLDLVVASRVQQGLTNKVTVLTGDFLPSDETSLRYLDHLVLAENRLVDDWAALTAVRRWVHAGGRLWIMLDRTDPILLERLFGDEFHGDVVDRVGLTTVRVDMAPSLSVPDGETGKTIEYDDPVEFSRIVVSDMKLRNTVNDWPAALTRTYGEGRVLITTLGPRGWIQPTPNRASASIPPEKKSDFVPTSPMEDLAAYILSPREPEVLPPSVLEPFAQEYVSYHVPTWGLMFGSMVGFLAVLVAIGTWQWKTDRLEHFGWSGSLLAALFGMTFIGIGMANRYQVQETIASVQIVRAIGGTDDVGTHGAMAVYRSEGSQSPILASQGGELWPDMTGTEGAVRRMVTTDLGTFQWEGLPQPAGLRLYPDVTSRAFAERIAAQATLNEDGIVGTTTGLSGTGADAIVATRQGRIGVKLASDGTLTASAQDVLEADQYLDATFLGDVQDRRRRILQQLFDSPSFRNSLDRPHLLLWLNDWESGFQFGDGLAKQGDTLLTLPLDLSRPPAGSEVLIPSPLLGYVNGRPPDGSAPSGFWDDARGEWQERSRPSTTWLSFQIPRGLLPLKATQARLEIKVSGLMGQIEILGVKNGEVVSLQTTTDPVGTLLIEVDDPDVLTVSENGELTLGVSAGVPTQQEIPQAPATTDDVPSQAVPSSVEFTPDNYWRIDSLSLQLRAITSERTEED